MTLKNLLKKPKEKKQRTKPKFKNYMNLLKNKGILLLKEKNKYLNSSKKLKSNLKNKKKSPKDSILLKCIETL
jgi:hypothetical protein